MTDTELAWVAGFFDGEGSVVISKNAANSFYLVIEITNRNSSCLQQLQAVFGGSIQKRDRGNPKWACCYVWFLGGGKAKEFLLAISPFLRIKGEQALVGIELQRAIDRFKYKKGRAALPRCDVTYREALKIKLAELNRRGPAIVK